MPNPSDWPEDPVGVIAEKYGWDRKTTLSKIRRTRDIFGFESVRDAVDFLLETQVPSRVTTTASE